MKKSFFVQNYPEEVRIDNFMDFLYKLQDIRSSTRWIDTTVEHVGFEVIPNANPFVAFGGSEAGCVRIKIDEAEADVAVPLRYTALDSLLARADCFGNGIKRLLATNPAKFVQHIEDYFGVKDSRKATLKALVQGEGEERALSALHSGAYRPISMVEVFEELDSFITGEFRDSEFITSVWNWEYTSVLYQIEDETLLKPYLALIAEYFPEEDTSGISMQLKAVSSDVAESAVRFIPYLCFKNGLEIPVVGRSSVKHMGNEANVETVVRRLSEVFTAFSAACRSLKALGDIYMVNKKNAMILACKKCHLPQKEASDFCEQYTNEPTNALEVYTLLCKLLQQIKLSKDISRRSLMNYEESLMKLLTFNRRNWRDIDVSGVVAWK